MIEIRGLVKRFGEQVVLNGVDLSVENGTMVGVLGPSGTGKSVLLKIIIGLLRADRGEVLVDGSSVPGTSGNARATIRKMSMLFQNAALFDSSTVLENVFFPLVEWGVCSRFEAGKRSLSALEEVGMRSYANALPGELSIGMRKRVGLARALVTEPEYLLLDEPNTGLDPQVGQEIYDLIGETSERRRLTGIVVSHEIPEVFQICDRVAMLYEGEIQLDASPSEFLHSENEVVRQFARGEIDGPISTVS